MQNSKTSAGFSLVELSIVLVILGLLTGGILGGQSLIKAAELRSITTEVQQYETAVNGFRIKYNALPGDFTQATRFWGRADTGGHSGQCANPEQDEGTGRQTCNGNGDGIIGYAGEAVLFWEHLSNAGLVQGDYTGAIASGAAMFEPGVEVPVARIGGSWIAMLFESAPGYSFVLGSGQTVNVTSQCGRAGPFCDVHASLTPQDAWSVDSKMDDGKPGTGTVQAGVNLNDCIADGDDLATADFSTAEYNLGVDSVECVLSFPQGNRGWADL